MCVCPVEAHASAIPSPCREIMSYRLLQKQLGVTPGETSSEARSVTQPQQRGGRGRGRGGGGPGGGGGGDGGGGYRGANASRDSGVAYAGNATNVAYPAPSGGFHGSSAQSAHVEAMRRANAAEAKNKGQREEPETAVATRSGLGLEALKERKAKEEEDRQAKRDAARAKRRNEVSKKEADDEAAIQECEAQATWDCEQNPRLKYEAALIVRIANKFGSAGVWMKIAEARARGANIPLDPRRVYLLAHPDKCPLEEASDATAILNAQRPPEMTEVKIAPKAPAPKGAAAAAAPPSVAAATPAEAPTPSATEAPLAAAAPPAASAASAAAATGSAQEEERKVDPEDGMVCSYEELLRKYEGLYTPEEMEVYWRDECKPKPRTRRY